MKYDPLLKINPNLEESVILAKKHIDETKKIYGD